MLPPSNNYHYKLPPEDAISVSDDEQPQQEQQLTTRLNALGLTEHGIEQDQENGFLSDEDDNIDEEDLDARAEETRLRYERLNARGRIQEIAYNNRIAAQRAQEREREHDAAFNVNKLSRRDRSRSQSKSRSRPSTPMLGALFKRDAGFAMAITRSQSPPVQSVPASEKSSRRPSVTNLFKFKPISRSSSSKSIHVSSGSSSQPNSPFPSPLTPLSPLPFFLSPKMRRKPMPATGEEGIEVAALSGPSPSFGSPLTRTPRRPSPVRTKTLPDDLYQDVTPVLVRRRPSHGAHVYGSSSRPRRESSPSGLGRSDNADGVPALSSHLVISEGIPWTGEEGLSLQVNAQ